MRWVITYTLYCSRDGDSPTCHGDAEPHFTKGEAVRAARAAGWFVWRGVALCPSCRRMMEIKLNEDRVNGTNGTP